MERDAISATARIIEMEFVFDLLSELARRHPDALSHPDVKALAQVLSEYYSDGGWLCDFELDEQGALPSGLRRGVLAEDGVYELLTKIFPCER